MLIDQRGFGMLLELIVTGLLREHLTLGHKEEGEVEDLN